MQKDSNQVFIIDSLRRLVKRQTPKGHPSQLQIAQRFGCKQFTGLFSLRVAPSSDGGFNGIKTKDTVLRQCLFVMTIGQLFHFYVCVIRQTSFFCCRLNTKQKRCRLHSTFLILIFVNSIIDLRPIISFLRLHRNN